MIPTPPSAGYSSASPALSQLLGGERGRAVVEGRKARDEAEFRNKGTPSCLWERPLIAPSSSKCRPNAVARINSHRQRMASLLEMSDRDFDRQATLGGLLSALRGTNESMNSKRQCDGEQGRR